MSLQQAVTAGAGLKGGAGAAASGARGISLRQVAKRYGQQTVIESLDLDIGEGELLVLLGPSGCGKSTLLRMIAGLEEISDGSIHMDGVCLSDRLPRDRDIAMIFQNYALYPHMTVAENMSLALKLRGVPRAEIKQQVQAVAASLGLTELLLRKPSELSGGQRQRVAMGRAIVRQPKAFLFDEPLSNLDTELRLKMRAEIKELHQRLGTTMVYVTHDQVEAMTLADRLVVMRRGVIEQVGKPVQVFQWPNNLFVAGFIGAPAMNIFPARLSDGQLHIGRANRAVQLPLTDLAPLGRGVAASQPVLVGLRPQYLSPVHELSSQKARALRGEVIVTEPLGTDMLVHTSWQDVRLTYLCPYDARLVPGQAVELTFDPAHVRLFHATTGDALMASPASAD